jgi:hypothetical protein
MARGIRQCCVISVRLETSFARASGKPDRIHLEKLADRLLRSYQNLAASVVYEGKVSYCNGEIIR